MILGMGKSDATSADSYRKHEGQGGSQARCGWSSASGMDSCRRNRSETVEQENGLGSTPKNGDGRATVEAGDRGLERETCPGRNTNVCRGGEHTQEISEALARAEALAR